ncbi:hypothetical protein AX16_008863 [Volvariella volvacea WC 439]|nr:hypothetical protein AX16_008863 [Volvariella volvacea WC 439]
MDKSAPTTVVQGTLVTCNAFLTGLYGIFKGQPGYGILAGAAAVNSGLTAGAFFSIREFIVSPILVSAVPGAHYARRRRMLGINRERDDEYNLSATPSWSELRTYKIVDTAASGAITGGLFRGWRSGPKAVLPGAITAAAFCALLQVAYNELGIYRINYISKSSERQSRAQAPAKPASQEGLPWTQRIWSWFGVRKMTDEEYLEKLKRTRDYHLKRIEELEQQVAEENSDKDKSNTP